MSDLPGNHLEVRLARPEEYAAVTELTLGVYVGGGYIPADDYYVEELAATEKRATEADVLVAVEDGTVLGAVTYCPIGSAWREIAAEDEGEFRMLAVSGAARGRGPRGRDARRGHLHDERDDRRPPAVRPARLRAGARQRLVAAVRGPPDGVPPAVLNTQSARRRTDQSTTTVTSPSTTRSPSASM
jgi:hypothetical protein